MMPNLDTFTAFRGLDQIAHGDLEAVAAAAHQANGQALVFDDQTGETIELDLRHGPQSAVAGFVARPPSSPAPHAKPGRGRPKLGVTAREVTLLPRHWDWLAAQPGGASAALRRLVEDARRAGDGSEVIRRRNEIVYRLMSVLAGNLPGFEDASRALFANDLQRLETIIADWPDDVSTYILRILRNA